MAVPCGIVITGAQEVRSVEIDPSAVDPDEVEMLQDLVMTAINEAISRSKELERERMGKIAGGMGMPGCRACPASARGRWPGSSRRSPD